MATNKPKVIKHFDKLSEEMQEEINNLYPDGFFEHLVKFADKDGKYVHALPFETEDRYYLVRMPALISPKVSKKDSSEDDHFPGDEQQENEEGSSKYTDLDTMQIGGNKKDDDEGFD